MFQKWAAYLHDLFKHRSVSQIVGSKIVNIWQLNFGKIGGYIACIPMDKAVLRYSVIPFVTVNIFSQFH